MSTKYRGRFAPSPTGPLHLGNAFTAYVAAERARHGEFLLRVEDLDGPRSLAGCEAEQRSDLDWFGLRFSPPLWRQSERHRVYAQAIADLLARGLAYYCTCSRKDLTLGSAPHGSEGPRYPGTCRGRSSPPSTQRADYSIRFLVADDARISFFDGFYGPCTQAVGEQTGDFVIARRDGIFAYQLAVVIDDAQSGVTEVVRGHDLLPSTGRQIMLAAALGYAPPRHAHVPLVLHAGEKLSKRSPSHTLGGFRAAGGTKESLRKGFANWLEELNRCKVAALAPPPSFDVTKLLP